MTGQYRLDTPACLHSTQDVEFSKSLCCAKIDRFGMTASALVESSAQGVGHVPVEKTAQWWVTPEGTGSGVEYRVGNQSQEFKSSTHRHGLTQQSPPGRGPVAFRLLAVYVMYPSL